MRTIAALVLLMTSVSVGVAAKKPLSEEDQKQIVAQAIRELEHVLESPKPGEPCYLTVVRYGLLKYQTPSSCREKGKLWVIREQRTTRTP